jgi:hypothetical protein
LHLPNFSQPFGWSANTPTNSALAPLTNSDVKIIADEARNISDSLERISSTTVPREKSPRHR